MKYIGSMTNELAFEHLRALSTEERVQNIFFSCLVTNEKMEELIKHNKCDKITAKGLVNLSILIAEVKKRNSSS